MAASEGSAPSSQRVLLLLIALGLIWGSAYPVIRFGIVAGATPIAFAATRYGISAVAIAGIALATSLARPSARSLGVSALLGLPIVALYGLFLYVGEATTSGGLSSILIGATPLLTTLFALPLLPGEAPTRWGYVGLVVGFAGVAVLVAPPPGITLATNVWGPILVLAAATSFAIGSVLMRTQRPQGETLWGLTVQFAVAAVFLAAVLPLLEPGSALPLTRPVLLSLAYLVALPSVAGYALYFYLHHHVGPGRANVVAYVNPVAALSIGTIVFAEAFHWWEVAGFGLIAVGLTLLTRSRQARAG
ncbi:MAG TPA: EamA family transporter [Thermoplasmata archaeon]|nr:EamA family transporter [Thermoplasmata archaeon]